MLDATTGPAWVDLEGAANVRDLGGLVLAGGGRTAPGVLLRADNLQGLTRRDVADLVERRGLRTVVDLRTEEEARLEGPGPLTADPRVAIRHRSLYPEAGARTDVRAEALLPWQGRALPGDPSETAAVRSYLGYLRDRPDSVVAALRDVAHGAGATVVHCAAGKDRTGVVVALALAGAGVARAAIVADYAATGERMAAVLARLRASRTYAADLEGRTAAALAPHPATIARVLDLLDEHCGGTGGWLDAHGFGPAERAALRRRLAPD